MNTVDRSFITHLVSAYSDTVLRIAYQSVMNIYDAEDIAQEVFLSLMKRDLSSFDEEHLKAYIIRAAVNQCKSFHRSLSRRSVVYLEDIEPVFSEEERSILSEVHSLPEKYRTPIYLYYYEGYSVEEIANILKKPKGTVMSLLKRGRDKLKIMLEEE